MQVVSPTDIMIGMPTHAAFAIAAAAAAAKSTQVDSFAKLRDAIDEATDYINYYEELTERVSTLEDHAEEAHKCDDLDDSLKNIWDTLHVVSEGNLTTRQIATTMVKNQQAADDDIRKRLCALEHSQSHLALNQIGKDMLDIFKRLSALEFAQNIQTAGQSNDQVFTSIAQLDQRITAISNHLRSAPL